jgi:hypothetical protein
MKGPVMITYIVDQLRIWVMEMLLLFVLLVILGTVLMIFATIYLRIVAKFRGAQPVTCPRTRGPALVQVAPFQSAVHRLRGDASLRLSECSLWPEHSGCAQNCSAQLATRH